MTNRITVTFNNQQYSLKDLSKTFDLSYTTVRRQYKKGLRDEQLVTHCLSKKRPAVKVGNKTYASRFEASKSLGISKSTFYRKVNNAPVTVILGADGNTQSKFINLA